MKGVLKVSKEQVIEIERYCDEHGITQNQRISELGLMQQPQCQLESQNASRPPCRRN